MFIIIVYSVEYYKLYLEDTSFLKVITNNIQVDTYISLNFFEYCISVCEMYKSIINYNKSIRIKTCHDIIPSMLKCKIYTKDLMKNGFLNNIYKSDILKQTTEINNLIFTKYIILKKVESIKVNYYLSKVKSVCSVALHIRYNDKCMKNNICNISYSLISRYINIINTIDLAKECNIYLASSNLHINELLKRSIGLRIIEYLPGINPSHSGVFSHTNKSNQNVEIKKIIGDIYFLSKADRFILSNLSTFSLLIYYIGAKYLNGSIKPMIIINTEIGKIDKLQIYDHINYYGYRKRLCKSSPFSNILLYPYHLLKFNKQYNNRKRR